MTQGEARLEPGRETTIGRRLRVGAIGSIAVGAAIVMGGAASLVTASAHHVSSTTAGTGTKADGSDFHAGTTFTVGTQIMDSGALGAYTIDPNRNVEFFLFGPSDPMCTGTPLKTWTDTPTGTTGAAFAGPVFAGPYTANGVGTYHWEAQVNFNGSKESGPTLCSDEPETITQAQPSIDTVASSGGMVGTSISDTATLSGAVNPTGKVTFELFSDLASCRAGTPVLHTSPAESLSASAPFKATSPSYQTTAVGTYQWVAAFAGDSSNKPVSSACGSEPVTISQVAPSIATTASAGGTVPVSVSDTATVSGGVNPTGTVTFTLYPSLADCTAGTNAVAPASTVTLSGGKAASRAINLTTAGTYQWVAKYSGDANNKSATSACGDEPVVTTSTTPSPSPSPTGGVQGITTPGTGTGGSVSGVTVGGFLLLGGLGVALAGSIVPRRRHRQAP